MSIRRKNNCSGGRDILFDSPMSLVWVGFVSWTRVASFIDENAPGSRPALAVTSGQSAFTHVIRYDGSGLSGRVVLVRGSSETGDVCCG